MHFGHCEHFALVEFDEKNKTILNESIYQPPPHKPGLLPHWLGELGANMVIAGGTGRRAQELFANNNITVLVGAQGNTAQQLVSDYLTGDLQTGDNCCDH